MARDGLPAAPPGNGSRRPPSKTPANVRQSEAGELVVAVSLARARPRRVRSMHFGPSSLWGPSLPRSGDAQRSRSASGPTSRVAAASVDPGARSGLRPGRPPTRPSPCGPKREGRGDPEQEAIPAPSTGEASSFLYFSVSANSPSHCTTISWEAPGLEPSRRRAEWERNSASPVTSSQRFCQRPALSGVAPGSWLGYGRSPGPPETQ